MNFVTVIIICSVLITDARKPPPCSMEYAMRSFQRPIYEFSKAMLPRIFMEMDQNFVFSPFSLWTILSVIAQGAEGETLAELKRVLKLHHRRCINEKYFQTIRDLVTINDDVTLEHSGLLVVDENLQLNETFLRNIGRLDVTHLLPLDFKSPDAPTKVNNIISEAVHGEIGDVVYEETFEESLLLCIDLVYFKGKWKLPFDPQLTTLAPFYDEEGQEIGQVNMMIMTAPLNTCRMDLISAFILELEYGSDERFSMLLFLPYENTKIYKLLDSIQKVSLQGIYSRLERYEPNTVELRLPRFKISTDIDNLADLVDDAGIRKIFKQAESELPYITTFPVYVSKLMQTANIEVTEEGTKASVVSKADITSRTMPEQFMYNRPFLYMIVERNLKYVLLSGVYSKPAIW